MRTHSTLNGNPEHLSRGERGRTRWYAAVGLAAAAAVIMLIARGDPTPAFAATFTVNSTADTPDLVIDGICDDGGGICTLRAAIMEANASPGSLITFNIIPPLKISPATALPDITQSMTIDGTSQPGYAGVPLIELSGPAGAAAVPV